MVDKDTGSFHEVLNDLLNSQEYEIQQLKAQLECGEDICRICKYTYLVPSGKYYIAQCKKKYSECSKGTVDYCEDFELKDSDSEINITTKLAPNK